MATVTGFTAEHMEELSDANIVDGDVVGGHLILQRRDLTTLDAGSVIGPIGPTGPTGPTSIAVCTSVTRPTGGALFTGLGIYETDTKRFYIYDGAVWVYRGGMIICTSGTRPSSPFDGLMIYQTDNDMRFIWDGTSWVDLRSLLVCTSATRPTGNDRYTGREIYETDTFRKAIWNGTNWRYYSSPDCITQGTLAITLTAQNSNTGTITFGMTFAVAPNVIVSVEVGSNLGINVNTTGPASTTTVPVRIFQTDGTAVSGTITLHWIAIGPA